MEDSKHLEVRKSTIKLSKSSSNKQQTPYIMTMESLHKTKANLLQLKTAFDDDRLNSVPHADTDLTSCVTSDGTFSTFSGKAVNFSSPKNDLATIRHLIDDSIAEIDICIDTMEEAGSLYGLPQDMALRQVDNNLSDKLRQISNLNSEFMQVSYFLANTYTKIEQSDDEAEEGDSGYQSKESLTSNVGSVKISKETVMKSKENAQRNYAFTNAMLAHGMKSSDMPRLVSVLSGIDGWDVDVFKLEGLCHSCPLTCITYTLFHKYNLMDTFKIPGDTLMRFLLSVEQSYLENPYHNNLHAAEVTHSTHFFLRAKALDNVLTSLEVFAMIFAAAIHDVGHPGVSNQFLLRTNSELAAMYNDDAVLEYHHLAVAFRLLQKKGCDVFANLDMRKRSYLRKLVADIVLATDLTKHTALLASAKIMLDDVKGKTMDALPLSQRVDFMKLVVHSADLSNPAKSRHVYVNWVERITQEWWEQGDEERRLGLTISPLCDRHDTNVCQAQVGFIDYIVRPLYSLLAEILRPHLDAIMDILDDNRKYYASKDDEMKRRPKIVLPTAPGSTSIGISIGEREKRSRRMSAFPFGTNFPSSTSTSVASKEEELLQQYSKVPRKQKPYSFCRAPFVKTHRLK